MGQLCGDIHVSCCRVVSGHSSPYQPPGASTTGPATALLLPWRTGAILRVPRLRPPVNVGGSRLVFLAAGSSCHRPYRSGYGSVSLTTAWGFAQRIFYNSGSLCRIRFNSGLVVRCVVPHGIWPRCRRFSVGFGLAAAFLTAPRGSLWRFPGLRGLSSSGLGILSFPEKFGGPVPGTFPG